MFVSKKFLGDSVEKGPAFCVKEIGYKSNRLLKSLTILDYNMTVNKNIPSLGREHLQRSNELRYSKTSDEIARINKMKSSTDDDAGFLTGMFNSKIALQQGGFHTG